MRDLNLRHQNRKSGTPPPQHTTPHTNSNVDEM